MRGRKIRSDVYWERALKQKDLKQGIRVLRGVSVSVWTWYKGEKFRPYQEWNSDYSKRQFTHAY